MDARVELVDELSHLLEGRRDESVCRLWVLHPDCIETVLAHVLSPDLLEALSRDLPSFESLCVDVVTIVASLTPLGSAMEVATGHCPEVLSFDRLFGSWRCFDFFGLAYYFLQLRDHVLFSLGVALALVLFYYLRHLRSFQRRQRLQFRFESFDLIVESALLTDLLQTELVDSAFVFDVDLIQFLNRVVGNVACLINDSEASELLFSQFLIVFFLRPLAHSEGEALSTLNWQDGVGIEVEGGEHLVESVLDHPFLSHLFLQLFSIQRLLLRLHVLEVALAHLQTLLVLDHLID